ncbi:MAG: coniferyl aldehyde dehydrogenase, partial [Acidobacteriaceae bacterium]|nr:coniferyl aldehyde dehydrogenase [Acidobacteriaceae bacterium]
MPVAESGTTLAQVFEEQRAAFRSNPVPDAAIRKAALRRLLKALLDGQEAAIRAVDRDFGGRSRDETLMTEIYTSASAIRHAIAHLHSWMRPRSRSVPLTLQPAQAWVEPKPLGVVGIISPWNFPINLTIIPLVSAWAAGNRVMIKPSEFTPETGDWLRGLLAQVWPASEVAVVSGDAAVAAEFTRLPFDHLLFTGSTEVGKLVMRAASENLTPVTLELGGKCPAIVAPDANLEAAAAAIAYGKLTNAGQICIAPDYALVPRGRLESFAGAFEAAARRSYPDGVRSAGYTAMISERHFERVRAYVREAEQRGVPVRYPLGPESSGKKLAPALLLCPPEDVAVMRDEIFGPILPVIGYDHLHQAIEFVNRRPKPLALYLFSRNRKTAESIFAATQAGCLCINDTVTHFAVDDLPFGGIGSSGMGFYHGEAGFRAFSHCQPVFRSRIWNPAVL